MAITEEEIKLILDTQDSSTQVHKLATEVEFLTGRMEFLAKEFNEGRLAEAQYVTSSQMVSDMLRERSALTEEVARATGILDKSHRDLGQTMLQGSYALQDFTSQLDSRGLAGALGAVQNNIPGILSGLGAGAGLAGVVSVLAVALGAALPHLQAFFGAMDPEKAKAAAEELKKFQAEADAMLKAPQDEPGKATAAAFGQYEQRGMGLSGAVTEAIKTAADREIATPQEAAQVAEHELHGGGFIPEMLGLSISPVELQKRLEDRTKKRATQLIAESGMPGATGKAARARLKKLAADNPNLFPNDFAQFMADVDEDPAERAAAEAAIEDEEGEKFPSGAAGLARGKAANEAENEARRRDDRIASTYVEDAKLNEQVIEKANREAKQAADRAAREAKQAADRAAREATTAARKAAHDADPSNQLAADRSRVEDQVTAQAMVTPGPDGWQPSGGQFRAMVSDAVNRVPVGGGNAEIAEAIAEAAMAGYQKSQRDMAMEARRAQAMSNQRGGQ